MEQAQTPWQRYADPKRKIAFAGHLHTRPNNLTGRFEAASLTFPDDQDAALARQAAVEYPNDRVVIEEMARLQEQQPEDELPTRAEQARAIYNMAKDESRSVSDRLQAHKLYAELMGHTIKDSGGNTYIDNRRVMVVPAAANTSSDWETLAVSHQQGLINSAATTL